MNDFGVDVEPDEIKDMFNAFDTGKTGSISFDELLVALRPPMRKCRRDLVMMAFKKLDRTNTGEITIDDLRVRLRNQNFCWRFPDFFENFRISS